MLKIPNTCKLVIIGVSQDFFAQKLARLEFSLQLEEVN